MTNETKNKLEILVVEDEHIGTAKKHFDSLENVNVDYVETKEDALSKLNGKSYTGILTDANFPETKGKEARHNGYEMRLEAMKKGMPWVEYSSHGPDSIFTFPIRRIDAEKAKQAKNYFDWVDIVNGFKEAKLKDKESKKGSGFDILDILSDIDKYEPAHEVVAFGGSCKEDPNDPKKIIGVVEYSRDSALLHQKTSEEGWRNAYSILQNVIGMYSSGNDLSDYLTEKAKETKSMEGGKTK